MESTVFSLELANRALSEDGSGFSTLEDLAVGDGVSEMEKRDFEYFSEYGLDFCKQHVLNARIIPVVETFFGKETGVLGHWLRYTAYPGHNVLLRRGGPNAGRRALGVHLLSKGSRVGYRVGSHRHDLPTTKGKRFTWEVSDDALDAAGCAREMKEFPDGGLAIFDLRVCFEIKEGYAITFEFATADIVTGWKEMKVPNTPGLVQRVADMESSRIQTNFVF